MKVLLPTMRDPGQIGGTSTHLEMLSKGLREIGHEAEVVFLGSSMPVAARRLGLVWPAGGLNRLRTGWGMMYAAEARGRLLGRIVSRSARDMDWDVINAQEVYSVPYLRAVADAHGLPLVLTLHGYPLYESVSEGYTSGSESGRMFLMRSEMRALRLADAIVTVDSRLYRHVLGLVPERAGTVHTLMNFIDTSTFTTADGDRAEIRSAWNVPDDRVVLFCPRRLVKKNGVVYPALALAAMEPQERQGLLLLYAGDGGERAAIEEVVRKYSLEGCVRLLGGQRRDAILDLYRLADIVLVPSVHSENVEEATSLSALEAMASGRPLIAGAVGGLAEIVDDGVTGLLVPGGDAAALASAICRLAGAPELRSSLAHAARSYVVANHSHLEAARAYADIYAESRSQCLGAAHVSRGTDQTGGPPVTTAPRWTDWPAVSVLGLPLHVLDLEEAVAWVIRQASLRGPESAARMAVSFNPELVLRAHADARVAEAIIAADLCYADGVGAVWAARRSGVRGVTRIPGIEFAGAVLQEAAAAGLPVFFLGGRPGVAQEAARRKQEQSPGLIIAGARHGYFAATEEAEVVSGIRSSGAAILLAALGAPKQELFLYRYRSALPGVVGLGVGGSFDVWSGTVKRAPAWVRSANLEWAYRVMSEPARAGRQKALVAFAMQVLKGSADDYGPPRRGGSSASLRSASAAEGRRR